MVKICTDSCVDIPESMIKENNISVLPLLVMLDDQEYYDGVNITPNDIFEYVKKTGQLPKTAARGVEDFKDFFSKLLEDGSEVIYCGIGNKLSSAFNYATRAKEELNNDKLYLVDSKSLSAGIGMLVLYASMLAKKGLSAKSICDKLEKQSKYNQTSFIVDKLDYLHKGGRCSATAKFGANLLKIKPKLELYDGVIENTGKFIGPFKNVVKKYIDDMILKYNNYKKDLCFIVHTCNNNEFIDDVVKYVKDKNIFDNVISTWAGATISSHCGPNTLGIIYLLEEK